MYIAVVIPLKLSFYLYDEIDDLIYYLDRIVKCFLFIQLLLRFLKPVYIKHEITLIHKDIAKVTFKSISFYLDLFSAIPWSDLFFEACKFEKSIGLSTVAYLSYLIVLVNDILSQYKVARQLKDSRTPYPVSYFWAAAKKSSLSNSIII